MFDFVFDFLLFFISVPILIEAWWAGVCVLGRFLYEYLILS